MARFASLSIAVLVLVGATVHADDTRDARVVIPLTDGRLAIRDLLHPVGERLGFEDLAPLERLDWSIDVHTLAGRARLSAIERLTGGAIELSIKPEQLEIEFDQRRVGRMVVDGTPAIERWMTGMFKYREQPGKMNYGLSFITADNARAIAEDLHPDMRGRIVMLVHGLDDPGMMWSDLIPELHANGFVVARFEYPNDGPVAEAADLLAHELEMARRHSIERMDVVAHSMGGLVVRDVLTRSTFMNRDGSGNERFPAIDRLIMCGTPNHGARIAHMRSLIELREHLFTAIATGQNYRDLAAQDGSGEAGRDLMPESDFLRRLNARAQPSHTEISIIAARWSPVHGRGVQSLVRGARSLAQSDAVPQWLQEAVTGATADTVENLADDVVDGLGDGCVSIESARLAGVEDFTIVRAGHLSMLLSLSGESTPPAIPIILERLRRPMPAHQRP